MVRKAGRFDELDRFTRDLVVSFDVPDKQRLEEGAAIEHKSLRMAESSTLTKQGDTVGDGAFSRRDIDTSHVVASITFVHVDSSLAHSERFEKSIGTSYCRADKTTASRGTLVMMANTPAMFVNDPEGLTIGGLPVSANCTLVYMGLGNFAVIAARPITTVC